MLTGGTPIEYQWGVSPHLDLILDGVPPPRQQDPDLGWDTPISYIE